MEKTQLNQAPSEANNGENPVLSQEPVNFIQEIINKDRETGKHGGRGSYQISPEPNGYLHIGHAKAICLDFGIAAKNGGLCNLRFDDTNPSKEDIEYVESIKEDIRWLGFDWGDRFIFCLGLLRDNVPMRRRID